MGDFDISFGKKKETITENDLKGGIKDSDIKDEKLLSIFNALDNGNKILEKSEMQKLRDSIIQYAGEDEDKAHLSKKEAKHLIKSLNIKVGVSDLFKFLGIIKVSAGKIQECITDENTQEVTVKYADNDETSVKYDRSGNKLSESKKALYNGMLGILTINNDGTLVFSIENDINANLFGDIDFKIHQNKEYYFTSKTEFNKKQPSKILTKSNDSEVMEEFKYHSNGEISYKKISSNGKTTNEYSYDENKNILEEKRYNDGILTDRTVNTWNGDKKTSEKVYDANNNLKSESTFDDNGRIKEKIDYYDEEYLEYAKVVTKYIEGKISEEQYLRSDGTLFRQNECVNGELKKQTEYFPDGIHKKLEIVYDGDNITTTEYDINGKIISKTSNLPDGYFGPSTQIGQGDCYLLASINAIRQTTNGQNILSNLIKKNGNSYTVTLPGAVKAAQQMKNDSRFKKGMYITGTYTFTATQLQDIMRQAGTRYSSGDPDVMLLEAAFEKYREEVRKTQQANNIQGAFYGFGGGDGGSNPDNVLEGGFEHDAIFILTGRRSEVYINYDQTFSMSDDDLQNYDQFYSAKSVVMSMPSEIISETSSKQRLNKMLDKIMNDAKDGHIDCIATCGFLTDGGNSGHALTIKTVTADKVILINPWNPTETITMTRAEFIQKVQSVTLATIPYQDMGNTTEPDPDPVPNPTPGPNPDPIVDPGQDNTVIVKTVTIPKDQRYNAFIKAELQEQGITNPTAEQITKAKRQFEAANPKTNGSQAYVHTWNQSSHPERKGNKYLIAGETYKVPKFNV